MIHYHLILTSSSCLLPNHPSHQHKKTRYLKTENIIILYPVSTSSKIRLRHPMPPALLLRSHPNGRFRQRAPPPNQVTLARLTWRRSQSLVRFAWYSTVVLTDRLSSTWARAEDHWTTTERVITDLIGPRGRARSRIPYIWCGPASRSFVFGLLGLGNQSEDFCDWGVGLCGFLL